MLTIYCGVPGSGKSSMAALIALKQFKKNKKSKRPFPFNVLARSQLKVFSNTPIIGAYKLDSADIGRVHIEDGIVLIDEAGIEFNNRSFKSFRKDTTAWFKLHRHYNCDVYVFSQSWEDMDKKIRDLAARIYVCSKVPLLPFIITRRVSVRIDIDDLSHKLTDKNYFVHPLLGGFQIHFVGRAWRLFDSYDAPHLEDVDFEVYQQKALHS